MILNKDIKIRLKKIRFCFKNLYNFLIHSVLNKTVKLQNKNYKSIPIIIISFNQLFYLKKLIDFLLSKNYSNLVIVDNNSTYKPLLDYFDSLDKTIKIHRLNKNYGHLVFWKCQEIYNRYSSGYHVITDADIVPDENCPEDFLLRFKNILNSNFSITKVGFSLKINDIPKTNPNKQTIIKWESQFWNQLTNQKDYFANIDTTFAIYRPKYKYDETYYYEAIRTKEPYKALHGGWYLDFGNLSEEQKHFFETCNSSSSWRVNSQGDLESKMYKDD